MITNSYVLLVFCDPLVKLFLQFVALNLVAKPCVRILDNMPSYRDISRDFFGYWITAGSCTRKCINVTDECCFMKCLYLESGLVNGTKLNKTLMAIWLSKNHDIQNQKVLGYIDECEAIEIY